jgi:hypothetical protein
MMEGRKVGEAVSEPRKVTSNLKTEYWKLNTIPADPPIEDFQ